MRSGSKSGTLRRVKVERQSVGRWGLAAAEYLRRNVLGLVAIFIALSGTAYANLKVGAGDIDRNAVRAGHIAKKHVRAKHLARNAVRSPHLAKRAVRPRHLMPGSIKGWAIADGAITAGKLGEDVAGMLVPDPSLIDGRAMGGDLTGTFPNPEIAPGAVGTDKLDDDSVTAEKIGPLAVGTGQIDDGAVTPAKIQSAAVQTQKLADDAVTSAKLGPRSLRGRHFFRSGTYVPDPGMIAPGACTGMNLFETPSGPAVAVASLAPHASPGLVATTGYHLNTSQLGVRICNLTAATLPVPNYVNYLFIEL